MSGGAREFSEGDSVSKARGSVGIFLLLARGSVTGSATRDAGGADLSGGAREFSEGYSLTESRGVTVPLSGVMCLAGF